MNDAQDQTHQLRPEPGDVGLVEPRDFVSTERFEFDSGQYLDGFTLRYETYGRLNAARDNAILILHALSGDHHCAGIHTLNDRKPGWWDNLIGPGKAVDTTKFFVICSNVLGGCQGSSGPQSTNPGTQRPYGMEFPFVTIRDMVRAQKRLCDHLGLARLQGVLGGSMGGMQALQWAIEYPDFVRRVAAMATTARESAQGIAFNEVGRQAIMQDPEWNHGDYSRGGGPRVGLAIARMMAHITYLSDASMDRKFGRKRKSTPASGAHNFDVQFEVESYLKHQGETFINRFDANSYLYITRAIDHFDLPASYGSLEKAFEPVQAESLVVGFTSDWLFPPQQNREIALALLRAGKRATYAQLNTDLGHDSFLLESPQLYDLIRDFFERDFA
ncbi:homoserine O-acetyltransferase [mine drainage metagenome]|uniref:Homoserine O-acetyltransferase n=1 Tax=mine drainage metagenome TaxID=410659 RepID=A0A1J5SW99_9ZZZZ